MQPSSTQSANSLKGLSGLGAPSNALLQYCVAASTCPLAASAGKILKGKAEGILLSQCLYALASHINYNAQPG